VLDPDTGGAVDPGTGGDGSGGTAVIAAVPVATAANTGVGSTTTLMVLAALILLGAVVAPPLVTRALRGRGAGQ
jgi:phosphate transport system substrate-binding protein